ncbi:MAG: hypothetical protein IJS68_02030 [Clostridia bacterium]|nr:hypothetical protein [Clostridia bacterium]
MKSKINYYDRTDNENNVIRQGVLMTPSGSVEKLIDENKNCKLFGMVVMCGHCTTGHYIPILFSVIAPNMQDAIEKAKHFPRVKFKDNVKNPNAILAAYEITPTESKILFTINDHDPYLTEMKNSKGEQQFVDREVINPNYISKISTIKDGHRIVVPKYSDEYDNKHVLQRFFAPIKQGDKMVYRKAPRKEELLYEYFSEALKDLPISPDVTTALASYLYLYGEPNKMGLSYKDGQMVLGLDNEAKVYPTDERTTSFLEYLAKKRQKTQEREAIKKEKQERTFKEPNITSRIERFKQRMAKAKTNEEEQEKGNE